MLVCTKSWFQGWLERLCHTYTVRVRFPSSPFERNCEIHDLALLVSLIIGMKFVYKPVGPIPSS